MEKKKNQILHEFIKYVSLNVCSMIGLSCYILADTYFVANGVGAHGLTSLNIAVPVFGIMNAIGAMLGAGAATKFAILSGQNRTNEGNCIFSHAVILGILASILFVSFGIFIPDKIATILGADQVTLQMTTDYLRTSLMFAPFFIFNYILNNMLKNDNAPRVAMVAMVSGTLINIILDYIFVFPLGWGMFGAAFATGISPIVGLVIMSWHFIKKRNTFHFVKIRVQFKEIRTILLIGTSSFIGEVATSIIIIVFNILIMRTAGNIGVAAYGIIANLALVVVAIFNGIAQGIQPLVSTNYGQGKKENIRKIVRYALITTIVSAGLMYFFLYLNADSIIQVFNHEGIIELQEVAHRGIDLYFTGIFFAGINILLVTYFSATENIIPSFIISLLRSGVIIIPVVIIMVSLYQMDGIWLSYLIAEAVISCIAIVMLGLEKKQKNR